MSIKVCHITTAHDSDDTRIFQKECVFLAKEKDFDVFLIAPGPSRKEKNVQVVGLGEKPLSRFKRMMFFTKKALKIAIDINADIYHFHDPELLNVGLKLKKMGKCVVFDSHEITSEQIKIKKYIPGFLRNLISDLYYRKETRVSNQIDAVIVPCLYDGKNWFEGRSRETVFVDNYPILSDKPRIEYNSYDRHYDICTIGSLTPERGITELLRGRKIAKCSLLMGGIFSGDDYKNSLCGQGLLRDVDYVGYCTMDKVLSYYMDSKIGISTILPVGQYVKAGNLPTKVYEFMSMSMPVILSYLPSAKEAIKEYNFALTVDPTDPEKIAEAIDFLLKNPEAAKEYGREGRRAIEEKYNWEKEVDKIAVLYRKITNIT